MRRMGPVFLVLIVAAILVAAATGRLDELTLASLASAKTAVELSIGLVGAMALFLGLMDVLKDAGLITSISRGLRPLFRRLFPDVPDGHPALGMMTMNISANMLGLGNAATPFGIEAMRQLDRLNGRRGSATDAMCLFLVINTSGISLFATGVVTVRSAVGSLDPGSILVSSFLATSFSTVVGIAAAFALASLPIFRRTRPPVVEEAERSGADEAPGLASDFELPEAAHDVVETPPLVRWRAAASVLVLAAAFLLAARGIAREGGSVEGGAFQLSLRSLPIPFLILGIVLYGWSRGVPVYESLVRGAKQGFRIAVIIIPYLVAILVAVGMFRASGALDALLGLIGPVVGPLGFPPEALPVALVRPLSGTGALGVMTEVLNTYGPDSFIGYVASTLYGSTETTFYVVAVYGGAVGMRRTRHAIPACLAADAAGAIGAAAACHLIYG